MRTTRNKWGLPTAVLVCLLASCGSTATNGNATNDGAGAAATAAGNAPRSAVTIADDCGLDVEVPTPPQRAVALEQGATEVMLSLGLADRMVGTSYLTDPVLPELADAYASVPVLADAYPSPEEFRAAEPDFAYSMLISAFTPEVAGTRTELAELGVPAYVTRTQCETADTSTDFSFDVFDQEIRDIGAVFNVSDRAEELIAEQQADRAAAEQVAQEVEGAPSIAWLYSTYNGAPIVAGPGGVPDAADDLLGATNVFSDLASPWSETSWEQIAARDPDVIVLADLTRGRPGDSAADKRALLTQDDVTANLSAVRTGRLIDVPGSALDPSVRTASAIADVARAMATTKENA